MPEMRMVDAALALGMGLHPLRTSDPAMSALTVTYPAALDRVEWSDDTEWAELRGTGLGGSDAAAVCGLNPWRGPYSVWSEKTGRHAEVVDSEAVRWGTLLEPVILAEWATRHAVQVDVEPHMLRSVEWPWMLANIDAVAPGAIVEIKTAGLRQADAWAEEPPVHYWAQGLHYCAVTGFRRCHFVCLIGGQSLVHHEVTYSEASIDHLVRIERDFWSHVEDDVPPPAAVEDVPVLKRIRPEPSSTVELEPELAGALTAAWRAAHAAETKAKRLKDEAAAALQALIGDCEAATVDGRTVATWKASERHDIDSKRLRQEQPDIAAAYERVTVVRRFAVPTPNDKEGD